MDVLNSGAKYDFCPYLYFVS